MFKTATRLSLTASLLAGCSVVSPPPVVAPHELALPKAQGTTTVSVVAGVGAGIWIRSGKGIEVRVSHQITTRNEIGAGLAFARANADYAERKRKAEKYERACEKRRRQRPNRGRLFGIGCSQTVERSPDLLGAVRFFGKLNPDPEAHWIAITYGLGLGHSDTGITYLTIDAGVRFATTGHRADVYAQPTLALSIPLARGPAINDKRLPTTFWFGPSFGVMANGQGTLTGSLDYTMLMGEAIMGFITAGGRYREGQ